MSHATAVTRERMVRALVSLADEKEFSAITVTDIAKRAGVSRMAYYRNYSSKEDIFDRYMDDVGQQVHESIISSGKRNDRKEYFRTLFEMLGAYSGVAAAAYKVKLGDLILANLNKNILLSFPPKEGDTEGLYIRYAMAGAFYNILIQWINNGKKETCEELAQLCCGCLLAKMNKL